MSGTKTPAGLTVTLQAVPKQDFAPGSHEREVSIDAHEVPVADIAEARQVVLDFIATNDLGGGNFPSKAGMVRQGGKPVARVSYNGRLWALDEQGKETDVEFQPEQLAAPAKSRHMGDLIRYLRTGAGLSRMVFGGQVGLGDMDVKAIETRRRLPTQAQLDRITAHPAMADLLARAAREGVAVELELPKEDDPEPGSGASGGPGRISRPHPHRTGHRCEIKIGTQWKHGPTRPTPEEAIAAAAAKLAAQNITVTVDPIPSPDTSSIPAKMTGSSDHSGMLVEEPEGLQTRDTSGLDGLRILGPYAEAGGFRCKIVSGAGQRSAPMARTKTEAIKLAERMAAAMAKEGSITIRDSLDAYLQSKRKAGVRPSTLAGICDAIEAYCRGMLDQRVGKLTTHRAQTQYDQLQVGVSVSTHRAYLSRTKSWARWVVSRGWLRSSPLEAIPGVGRRKRGKAQLS